MEQPSNDQGGGKAIVEYGLIIFLVLIVLVAVLILMGPRILSLIDAAI